MVPLVVIHTNTNLHNQIECAEWLRQGFERHGIEAVVTPRINQPADIHVIQGPWYAYKAWVGKPRVLWLNRCFYGDSRFDLSLGWLREDGSRDFRNHGMAAANGSLPCLRPQVSRRRRAVIFKDYGRDIRAEELERAKQKYESVSVRPHPAERKPLKSLKDVWESADVAIGHSSTVLVEAAINGLYVESSDPLHVIHDIKSKGREAWLRDLSWAQWNGPKGIASGAFWEHLCIT